MTTIENNDPCPNFREPFIVTSRDHIGLDELRLAQVVGAPRRLNITEDAVVIRIDPPIPSPRWGAVEPIPNELLGYILVVAKHIGPSVIEWLCSRRATPFPAQLGMLRRVTAISDQELTSDHLNGMLWGECLRDEEQAKAYNYV